MPRLRPLSERATGPGDVTAWPMLEAASILTSQLGVHGLAADTKLLGYLGDQTIPDDAEHGVITLLHFSSLRPPVANSELFEQGSAATAVVNNS